MFRLKVPTTVTFTDQKEKVTVSFSDFMFESILQYKPLGYGQAASKLGARIKKRLHAMNGEATVDLETDEFNTIRESLKTVVFLPHANINFEEYYEAVEKGVDLDKEKKPETAPEKK
jgi:hypothetical protein